MERAGYRWRFFVAAVFGAVAILGLFGPRRDHGPENWAAVGALFLWVPLCLSFLVSAVGLYRGWRGLLFFRLLPAVILTLLAATLFLSDCA